MARQSLFALNLHIYKLALRGLGVLNSEGPEMTGEGWLLKTLSEQMEVNTIIDVGANTDVFGYKEFPKATIYACEPHPLTFTKLQKLFKDRKGSRLKLLNVAMGEKSGKMKLWDFADEAALKPTQPTSTLASLDKRVITELYKQKAQAYQVKVMTLDELGDKEGLNQIDMIKVDTEGHELKVLKGGKKMINQGRVKIIVFEVNEMNVKSRVFMEDYIKLLPQYDFYRLLPQGAVKLDAYRPVTQEIFGFQNIVCVRKDIAELVRLG